MDVNVDGVVDVGVDVEEQIAPVDGSAHATGQKRPRDYGESLKGLTPEREDNANEHPSPKRSRLGQREPSSEGLDEGEIEETPSPTEATVLAITSPGRPDPSRSPTHTNEPATRNTPSNTSPIAQGAGITSQGTELDPLHTQGHGPVSATETPQTDDQNSKSGTDGPAASGSKTNSQGPNSTKQGIGLGLRTSFAKVQKQPRSKKIVASTPGIVEFVVLRKTWKIDASEFEQFECQPIDPGQPNPLNASFWEQWTNSNIDRIIAAIDAENQIDFEALAKRSQLKKFITNGLFALTKTGGFLHGEKSAVADVGLQASTGFKVLSTDTIEKALHRSGHLKSQLTAKQSKNTRSTKRTQAPDQIGIDDQELADERPLEAGGGETAQSTPNGTGASNRTLVSHEELEHRRTYFPGTESNPLFCTHCVGIRHATTDCPQLACQFCGERNHTRWGCPTKQRCAKCRQVGHTVSTCQEKLALAKEETPPCAICGNPHTEDECEEIWLSYDAAEVEIKKVQALPAFCFVCGQEGHYGPECGIADADRLPSSASKTWSLTTRDLYIDPGSRNVAIAWVGIDMNHIQRGSNFVRGGAKKATHIQYISSDDSDDQFIKRPINKTQPHGPIHINTVSGNRGPPPSKRGGFSQLRRSQESNHRENQREFSPPPLPPLEHYQDNGTWQPPLPTGPPPPLPPNKFQGYTAPMPQAPPGTLPPRPGNRGKRNVSNGSRSSRGHRPRRGRGG